MNFRAAAWMRAAVFAAIACATATAQEYRGRIQGTVTDPSQAVISGATVTLSNVNTGINAVHPTNGNGHYIFDLVEPGTYQVTVEATGFSKVVQENISLATHGDVTVDVTLRPGDVQQTVTVSAEANQVEFNSSNLETTVNPVLTSRMPQYYRSPFLLAQLDPSVVPQVGNTDWNPFNSWGPVSQSIGGGASSSSDLQVDGSPTGIGVKNSYQPISDAVEEVNVQQNSVDAEYGHSSGSAITMTTKSGTNEWHGLAYYQGQYPWANAMEDRVNRTVNLDRKQIFGGTLGNPILKNKLFNFAAFEAWQYVSPGSFVETLPTALEQTGNYSQSLNANGGLRTIYDPWSTLTDGHGNVTRTAFPGNVIPTSRIDPIAAKYTSMLWQPTSGGIGPYHTNNYAINLPVNYPYRNFSDRVDYNIKDNLRVSSNVGLIRTSATTTNPTGSPLFQNDRGSQRNATMVSGNVTYTVSPTTILNIRGDYHSFVDASNFVQAAGAPTFASVWPNQSFYSPMYATAGIPKLIPRMSILDTSGTNQLLQMGAQNGWWHQTPNAQVIAGQISHQQGNHFIKGGVEWRLSQVISALTNENPGFGFDAAPTSSTYSSPYSGPTNVSGDGYATFLLGAVAPVNAGNQNCWACGSTSMPITIIPNTRDQYYAGFVNDDWHVSRKLTLNLGLRYEHTSPYYEAQNQLTAPLNLSVPNQIVQNVQMPAAVRQYYPGSWTLNGAYQFEGPNTSTWNNSWGSLSPRAGFAYKVNDRTSVRAGYARYYTPWEEDTSYEMENADYYGYSVVTGAPPMVNGVPQMTLSNPFPASYPLTQATGKSLGANTGLGDSVSFVNPNRPYQYSDRVNVGFETELPGGIVTDVTYFFNYTHQACDGGFSGFCYSTKNLDMMDPRLSFQYGNSLNQAVPNPFYGLNMQGPLASQQFVSIGSLMVPYPQYQGISETDGITGANMRYNSLQVKVQRRFSRGYTFLAGYNYHVSAGQAYYDSVAQYVNKFSWEDSGLPRQRLTISGSWEVPLGKGRAYLSNTNRLVDGVVGGWIVTGLMTYQSGAPIKFTNVLVTGNPGQNVPSGAYFNPAAVQNLPAYTEETNPWYYPGVDGPRLFNVDASMVKDFHVTERIKFSLRMDAFNALNSVNWAAPNVNPGNPAINGRSTEILTNTFGRQLQLGLRASF